ncbi:hypothetical protein OZX62_05230 [Bifidobacterium sp. ESL0690]|uniref:hypothetical protein n=1 Tax=Bifidobacterium sp. ESL0690 TaxID=2983214 RepID=UPI0023FA237C|nr:hypothetical protein [Bifidobacterium sp. ESL0690]WEV47663.1 hypothetical protein OZX62_05230 [Bifidobacterium sp. ESL0690]
MDIAQILGGISIFFAVVEYRAQGRRRKGSALNLRVLESCHQGSTLVVRITNSGTSATNILDFWEKDAHIEGKVASCIPSQLGAGESIDITFTDAISMPACGLCIHHRTSPTK